MFQSRNGLIWTATSNQTISYWYVSIPQRSDLNIHCCYRFFVSVKVSIPQRSDLNLALRISVMYFHLCFNPATVWFELYTLGANSIYENVQFQSRNGLIWTLRTWQQWQQTTFQSRNGLIWTEYYAKTSESGGNRFQSRNGLIWTRGYCKYCECLFWFQSRNGLIWTMIQSTIQTLQKYVSIPQRSDLNLLTIEKT